MVSAGLSDNSSILDPSIAPENPDFVKYQEDKSSNQPETSTGGYENDFMPAPLDLSHLSDSSSEKVSNTLDYNGFQDTNYMNEVSNTKERLSTSSHYDLRTLNRVTSVKNQSNAGTCWIFASYASLESYLMPEENRDFSENNMKNLLSSAYPDGFDRSPNDGGSAFMSTAYLARWSGPVDEKDDSYSTSRGASPKNLSLQKHVQNVFFLPDRRNPVDNKHIKCAVQNYGAVFTSMYQNNSSYSAANYSYYYNGTAVSNHGVAIVGWDDSFDRNKFLRVPPGNGAFIVKNSWGPNWGENGYYYVSYYDSNIGNSNAIFTAESPENYEYIYQYDPLGITGAVGYRNNSAWCANIFTAKSDEILKAVSFYTTDSNCNYEIYIYTDPKLIPITQTGPVFSTSRKLSLAGYHTVCLNSEVHLQAGQNFSVVLKLNTPGYDYPIAMEIPVSGWSSKAKAYTGESFVSFDGINWTDITTYYSNTNVCIKAFTVSENRVSAKNSTRNLTED
jgi:C1A family cysteine protease